MKPPKSLPGIVDVHVVCGRDAPPNSASAPDLLIEIPHGATLTDDFTALAARLKSPLPDGLVDFFHVNTDAGAPELGLAVAHHFVAAEPTRTVVLMRCRIPRTFIDCNRRIDASPEEYRAGKLTPGLMPWVTTTGDRALLRAYYDDYVAEVRETAASLGPAGATLLLHTYAPRSVDVEVDLKIVENLRHAYQPEVWGTWPLRPMLDVICRDPDGTSHAPAAVVEQLRAELAPVPVAESATYPLHPSSLAWEHVMSRPGRALCLEVRRDLVADPFEPFAQMHISAAKVDGLARPLASALRRWW
ncbi:MAG: hypothetical protein EXR69_13655 [Myxococcales bacterium]|nr:hypothetical protein [Myxococcales bacterium]